MIFFILGLSVLFFILSQIITESSAPYLLSGYNTMSPQQQSQVDIKGLVVFWQKFHKVLALFILVFGTATYYLVDEDLSVIGSIVIALLAYGVFLGKSMSYYPSGSSSKKYVTGFVQAILVGLSVFIALSYLIDTRESQVIWHEDGVEFSGYQGLRIPYKDISEVALISEPVDITSKIKGLGTSKAKKGIFTVKTYGPAHLLVTNRQPPYLMIRYDSGKKLIYNSYENNASDIKLRLDDIISNLK